MQTEHGAQYFIEKSRSKDLEDTGLCQNSFHPTHHSMLMIIWAKYGQNQFKAVGTLERTRQDISAFSIEKSWSNDLKNTPR